MPKKEQKVKLPLKAEPHTQTDIRVLTAQDTKEVMTMAVPNLNDLALRVTKKEGKKISISNAQVKEVIKGTLEELAAEESVDVLTLLKRYKPKKV